MARMAVAEEEGGRRRLSVTWVKGEQGDGSTFFPSSPRVLATFQTWKLRKKHVNRRQEAYLFDSADLVCSIC